MTLFETYSELYVVIFVIKKFTLLKGHANVHQVKSFANLNFDGKTISCIFYSKIKNNLLKNATTTSFLIS